MIVVIQCAASKASNAGNLVTADGTPVIFVAHPEIAPKDNKFYGRPDDDAGQGKSWREGLLTYNQEPRGNVLNLLPAYRLYENPVYERLVDKLGIGNVYILSAGWGLIRSDFLTPNYDITFSPSARGIDAYKRRRKADPYNDFCMLPKDTEDEILFLGGTDYVPLFCSLTKAVRGKRTVFHSAEQAPEALGCVLLKFETSTRTNWHYQCARALLNRLEPIATSSKPFAQELRFQTSLRCCPKQEGKMVSNS